MLTTPLPWPGSHGMLPREPMIYRQNARLSGRTDFTEAGGIEMKTLKKILIGLVVIVLLVVIGGLLLPRTRHVERSVSIDSPPCVVFARLDGFRSFNDWSPFVAITPDATYSYEGPEFGVGAKMIWTDNAKDSENGSQEIVATTPYDRIDLVTTFDNGDTAKVTYLLTPENGGTNLTWSFETDFGLNIIGRYFGILLDRTLGPLYEQGLINLKRIVEELPKVGWSDIEIGITTVPSRTIAYITGSSSKDPGDIEVALSDAFGKVALFISRNGLQIAGPPLTIANYWDDRGYGFDAGMPVSGSLSRGVGPESPVRMGESYGGRVVRAVHVGPYTEMATTYTKIDAFIAAYQLEPNGRSWESYVSDPASTPEDELITEIFFPVK